MKPTRAGHRRREDVPHRRRGGAVGRGLRRHHRGQRPGAGLAAWQREPSDLVILDRHLPDTDGIAVLEAMLREARERGVDTLVVIATAYADVASAVQALKLGAFDYLSKPLQLPELVVTVRKALEAKRLRAQVRQLAGRARRRRWATSSPARRRRCARCWRWSTRSPRRPTPRC